MRKQAGANEITAADLSALTGLTDRRHRQLSEQGYFNPPHRGIYDRENAIAGLFRYFQEQLHKKDDTLRQEQQLLTKAKREKTQEELAIIRKQYVRKSEIGPALKNVSLHQRAMLQFRLEQVLAPQLANRKPLEIIELIHQAVDDICRVFHDGVKDWLVDPPAAAAVPESAPAAPKSKRKK